MESTPPCLRHAWLLKGKAGKAFNQMDDSLFQETLIAFAQHHRFYDDLLNIDF